MRIVFLQTTLGKMIWQRHTVIQSHINNAIMKS